MADEITTQILIQIRDEIRATNTRVEELRAEVDRRFDEVDQRFEDVGRSLNIGRIVLEAMDTRLGRIEDGMTFLPRRVDVLEQKVARIENELGLDHE